MTDFSVPLLPDSTTTYPPKRASEEAFYAVANSGVPIQELISNYDTARTDLEQTGQSNFISAEEERWNREQDVATKETIKGIVEDETVSPQLKKAILHGYALTGSVSSSLKDRYVQKTASTESGNTLQDKQSQDEVVTSLPERVVNNQRDITNKKITDGYNSISENVLGFVESLGKTWATTVHSVFASIPAGYAGIYSLIKDQDNEAATNLIRDIGNLGYKTIEENAAEALNLIKEAIEYTGIPAKEIGTFTLEQTGSPLAATAAEILLDPRNLLGLGFIKREPKFIEGEFHRIPDVEPKVAPDSPLAITNVANPKAAEVAAGAAVKDPTGKLASALGVNKGEIVHDWILPKLVPDKVAKAHPDLMEELNLSGTEVREAFKDSRYDPNIINATAREAEVEKIFQIIKETTKPYYVQSMSTINETDNAFEGIAIYGRNGHSGYSKVEDAIEARDKLKEIITSLPEELKGTVITKKIDGKWFVEHQWKKEYDELSILTFGKDSIQTSVLGKDVSGLARSPLGRHIFATGRFPKWVENGALRGIERSAALREVLTKPIRDHIANTKHGKELDYIINDAEEIGKDYYSKNDMQKMFPHLTTNEINDLFVTHTWWRRTQQYIYNFLNREHRNKLVADNMEGMYDKNGNYIGAATQKISPKEIEGLEEVWDVGTSSPVKFSAIENEKTGKTLVRLQEKINVPEGVYHYGLIDGKNNKLSLLPYEVLTRLPGYSPRKVAESWYVDVHPTTLNINGKLNNDKAFLRKNYTETKAAAKTEKQANAIAEQMKNDHPDMVVTVRPERTDNFGRVMTDYQIHQEFLKNSMKRGERLPSIDGPARLEDRMTTLLNTTNSLSRRGVFSSWDEAFQKSFMKGFSKFTKGEFPQYQTDIKPLENMGRDLKLEYNTAHELFKYYKQMKNMETLGDFVWTKSLNGLADVLEKWKIPSTALRGKHKNPLMLGKTVATVSYIHLSPLRQWLIQPWQQVEMYMINPSTASKNFSNMMAIRMYIGADSKIMQASGGADIIKTSAKALGEAAGNKDFLDDVKAIRESGMLQSIDMNSIVHGVFKEVDRNLVENIPEKVYKDVMAYLKAVPRASRSAGFDAAELTNRVGNWLQIKDIWIAQNPGKDWRVKENLEQISAEALKLSGAMNRAGALPYQDGILSIGMQFVAINQKMLLNIIQDNATILSASQRARLAATRMVLYGGKYGIPGAAIGYYLLDKYSDNEELKKNAETFKRGFVDYATNKTIAALVYPDDDPDLAISKILTPYSDGGLPFFQFMWESAKLFDEKPAHPRYPAIGATSAFGTAVEDMQSWWVTREINEENYKQMFMEAAEVASGFNHFSQGLLMLGMRDKITKMGNKYGMEFTKAEAYAKMTFGIGTQKEQDLWDLVELNNNMKAQKAQMAKDIYRYMENQRTKLDDKEYSNRVKRLNSFINLLDPTHFSTADKLDIINNVEELDKKSYLTIKQSILMEHWKYHLEKRTQEWKQVDEILRRSPDKEIQQYIKALDEGKL